MLLLQEKKVRTLFQRTLSSLALQPRLLVHTIQIHTLIQTRPLQSVRNLPPSDPLPIRPLLLDELSTWVYGEEHRALLSSSRQLRSTVERCGVTRTCSLFTAPAVQVENGSHHPSHTFSALSSPPAHSTGFIFFKRLGRSLLSPLHLALSLTGREAVSCMPQGN